MVQAYQAILGLKFEILLHSSFLLYAAVGHIISGVAKQQVKELYFIFFLGYEGNPGTYLRAPSSDGPDPVYAQVGFHAMANSGSGSPPKPHMPVKFSFSLWEWPQRIVCT